MHLARLGCKSWFILAFIIAGQIATLSWVNFRSAPAYDDVPFLVSGLAIWEQGRFDLYRVNPPLIRAFATIPVFLFQDYNLDLKGFDERPRARNEFPLSRQFYRDNGLIVFRWVIVCRFVLMLFPVCGSILIWNIAGGGNNLWRSSAATILWAASPNVIASSISLNADVPCAVLSLGTLAAAYAWAKSMSLKSLSIVLVCGVLAILSKFTALLLLPIIGVLPFVFKTPAKKICSHGGVLLLGGLFLVNLAYGFKGFGQKLGEYSSQLRR